MLQKQRKIIEFSGSMVLSAVVFLLIYKFIPIVYATNDDRMIAEIISGQFSGTPEAYAIQMSYGFTWFLSKLYEVTNDLNWYGIALLGTQILSFGSMLYRLQSFGKKWTEKLCILAASIGLFLALWLKVYVQMTYTSTAAFVGLAAIFWYATSKTNWKNCLMAGILANLAFCIRPNVFYMLVPATGLVYLWKIFGKKEQTKLTIAAPFLILAVTAGLFFVNSVAYAKPEWKEFMAFFDDRTQIYDYYDLADFEDHPELYEPYGIDKTEYDMIRVYNYTTMGEEPKTFFPEYIAAYEEMEQREGITFTTKAVNAVKTFFKDVFTGEYGVENTVLFVAAAVLLFVSFMKKRYLLSLYLGTQWAANTMLWLYFTYWQRAIDRIQISMSLIFLAVILHVLYELCQAPEGEETEPSNKKAGSFVILFVLVGIFVFAGNMARIPAVDTILSSLLEKSTLLVSVASCQVMSNVPSAILLSQFTTDYHSLLLGVNIGGTGTLIASLASLITFSEFRILYPGHTKKYFLLFTLINFIFLAIMLIASKLFFI